MKVLNKIVLTVKYIVYLIVLHNYFKDHLIVKQRFVICKMNFQQIFHKIHGQIDDYLIHV